MITQSISPNESPSGKDYILQVRNLSRQFGTLTAVGNLSFEVRKKEIFGLLGPNGAGKTTTISMICGLLPPTGGSVRFSAHRSDPRQLIGYCPQENVYYPRLTCLEQLTFMGYMYGMKASAARQSGLRLLGELGLGEKAHSLANHLSGGMKRRLNICLALIHQPEILILDEPEAGLDPQSRLLVREFIRRFGEEKTVILTTHNMDEADRLAHRLAIMDHGGLLMLDTPQNLKKSIGEGDMVELVTENADEETIARFCEKLSPITSNIKHSHGMLLIKHPTLSGHLPAIRSAATDLGMDIREIRLRENTLEDVFIHLTGRALRT